MRFSSINSLRISFAKKTSMVMLSTLSLSAIGQFECEDFYGSSFKIAFVPLASNNYGFKRIQQYPNPISPVGFPYFLGYDCEPILGESEAIKVSVELHEEHPLFEKCPVEDIFTLKVDTTKKWHNSIEVFEYAAEVAAKRIDVEQCILHLDGQKECRKGLLFTSDFEWGKDYYFIDEEGRIDEVWCAADWVFYDRAHPEKQDIARLDVVYKKSLFQWENGLISSINQFNYEGDYRVIGRSLGTTLGSFQERKRSELMKMSEENTEILAFSIKNEYNDGKLIRQYFFVDESGFPSCSIAYSYDLSGTLKSATWGQPGAQFEFLYTSHLDGRNQVMSINSKVPCQGTILTERFIDLFDITYAIDRINSESLYDWTPMSEDFDSNSSHTLQEKEFRLDSAQKSVFRESLGKTVKLDVVLNGCNWGTALFEQLKNELTSIVNAKFRVLERQDLQQVLDEHRFSMSGLVSDETPLEAGQFLGAQISIVLEIGCAGDEVNFYLKAIDNMTSEVLWTGMGNGFSIDEFINQCRVEFQYMGATTQEQQNK